VLHSCPVPNVDFASLSLLMEPNHDHNNNNETKECYTNDDYYGTDSFIELSVVNSPLSMTPPSVASQALHELHDTLAQQSLLQRKMQIRTAANTTTDTTTVGGECGV